MSALLKVLNSASSASRPLVNPSTPSRLRPNLTFKSSFLASGKLQSKFFSSAAQAQESSQTDIPVSELVSAADVKKLRDITGSSIGNCRRALVETKNDLDKALDWLKRRNVASAKTRWEKSRDGALPEGLIGMSISKTSATLIKIGAETDFVMKNENFQAAVKQCADNVDVEKDVKVAETSQADFLTQVGAKMGESVKLVELQKLEGEEGVSELVGYVHPFSPEDKLKSSVGRVGAIVKVKAGWGDSIGKKLARHIAAQTPKYATTDDVDPDVIESEKQILRAQMENDPSSSKIPAEKRENVINGKMKKFFGEEVLFEQNFLYEDALSVKEWLKKENALEGVFLGYKLLEVKK